VNQLRTRIKICGITRTEDALAAVHSGADALGLVFFKDSPRYVSIEKAQEIVNALPALVSKVGLFVDADAAEIKDVLSKVPLDYIQFHGDEDESFCTSFSKPYIKAIRIKPETDLSVVLNKHKSAAALLLDAWHPDIAGGTGETFDWNLLADTYTRGLPEIILAGGLNADNVYSAVKLVKPYAVDVSSGVESSPGIKSAEKIQNFVKEVNRGES
jgi:phosphoribosylanthranilate isomerase